MLSKSRYRSGLQCSLRLWLECYDREVATPVGPVVQAVFDRGHAVGHLATTRFPSGVMIASDHRNHPESVRFTRSAMAEIDIPAIFEAGFIHQDVRVRVDILQRARRGEWNIIEVKSTARLKDNHVDDAAVQTWVAAGAGVQLGTVGVMTLDTSYVYEGGPYDLHRLFQIHDVTDGVQDISSDIGPRVAEMHTMLAKAQPPEIEPGPHCFDPYECPFYEHCTRDMVAVDNSIGDLPRLHPNKRALLEDQGIETIVDIPDDFKLSRMQDRVRTAVINQTEYVSPTFSKVLAETAYPIHHLDFESFMPALPRYIGTRPFQTLPFQWSNHLESRAGTVRHEEWLSTEDADPRESFARTLLESLGPKGSICIYGPYEKRIIRETAEAVPRYRKGLLATLDRCWDLLAVLRQHFYHPAFRGSFSLKATLPALVPDMSYDSL